MAAHRYRLKLLQQIGYAPHLLRRMTPLLPFTTDERGLQCRLAA
jgi:hypothetical protein